MEAMAITGIHIALQRSRGGPPKKKARLDMQEYFERSLCTSVWLNVQRTNTTKREMDFFKERRQILFFQWGLSGRGVICMHRDEKGQFARGRSNQHDDCDDRDGDDATDDATVLAALRKRKFDGYSDVFHNFYPEAFKVSQRSEI